MHKLLERFHVPPAFLYLASKITREIISYFFVDMFVLFVVCAYSSVDSYGSCAFFRCSVIKSSYLTI